MRGCGFEIIVNIGGILLGMKKFPSPCGDVVLKLVFRVRTHDLSEVSVPLRGCGFEISALTMDSATFSLFPSPCGDVVLKSSGLALGNKEPTYSFPSPCGDVVLKLFP